MPTDKTEGHCGPRWPTLCAILLAVTVVFPCSLWRIGKAEPAADVAATAEVARAASTAVEAGDDEVALAMPAKAVKRIAARLDARSLLDLFHAADYHIDQVRSGSIAVPRLVLADLPHDIDRLESSDDRKAVFVKTMLPLILLANERIEADRDRLSKLHQIRESGQALAPQDRLWLADLAERYGVEVEGEVDTKDLLKRVDIVPPSLALAQAAEESGWGTSRFAQKANVLFGQLTWKAEDAGVTPRNRQPGQTHRYRAFDDPKASVEAYIHNLNTHRAYEGFRRLRASLRTHGKPLDGVQLVSTLERYSERGADYVHTLQRLIRSNKLADFDQAVLRDLELPAAADGDEAVGDTAAVLPLVVR
ncbi:glucosaminidase domain-containing protein [Oleisolibacter albus]|uniref:glucosaminidase domain-containing protein n=1 Tax=Oleisolibacter albus TaxID=2171757 RepID=UPI000DF1D4B2|nr:glucosaminidase domain-containing protein [Oleisolibacter albus]